jgi:hypothetical protein
MTPPSTLTTPLNAPAASRRDARRVRFAAYGSAYEPPAVEEVSGDEAALIEALFSRAAASCHLPPLAVREVIENLVHADFEGACVSAFDGGTRLRVSDCGPGIPDKHRALEPGYSTACDRARGVVRGVGSGLPIASAVMESVGGALEIDDNLRGGTVVTLSGPGPEAAAADETSAVSEDARRLLALLLEIAPASPAALAKELSVPLGECGRDLVFLEHRGLVARGADGERSLTPAGVDLLTTLF